MNRLGHLKFGSSERDSSLEAGNFELSDFFLPSDLLKLTKQICLAPGLGSKSPRQDILARPLLRKRAPRVEDASSGRAAHIEWFPSALIAIQDQVFETIKRRPNEIVDDIEVANFVARCADGETAEAYGYIWAWQDDLQRLKLLFESSQFHPCSGESNLSSLLLKQTVGRLSWATCGKPTGQAA